MDSCCFFKKECIFAALLERPRNINPLTMRTPSTQIIVSKYLFLSKGIRAPWTMADPGLWEKKEQVHIISWSTVTVGDWGWTWWDLLELWLHQNKTVWASKHQWQWLKHLIHQNQIHNNTKNKLTSK